MKNSVFLKDVIMGVKENEGFIGKEYKDHLGFPTIGYGTKLPLTEEEAELLLTHRLSIMEKELQTAKPFIVNLPSEAIAILMDMMYQMGVPNLLKFKRMWAALYNRDYSIASLEMLDSAWAKQQTPSRARRLADRMIHIV